MFSEIIMLLASAWVDAVGVRVISVNSFSEKQLWEIKFLVSMILYLKINYEEFNGAIAQL